MTPYLQNLLEEADELDKKIHDLATSISNQAPPELNRMERQLDAMRLYSYCLHNRIKHFLP